MDRQFWKDFISDMVWNSDRRLYGFIGGAINGLVPFWDPFGESCADDVNFAMKTGEWTVYTEEGILAGYQIVRVGWRLLGLGGASQLDDGFIIGEKIARQMQSRGWTNGQIVEAIRSGRRIPAMNRATGNPAIRYVHPKTGQSVVVDTVTNEVIHVGGPGFLYGPASGDLS
jgi:hypothetical protein